MQRPPWWHVAKAGHRRDQRLCAHPIVVPVHATVPASACPSEVAQRGVIVTDRIFVCHSPQERCGIREYGRQLDVSLAKLVTVRPLTFKNDLVRIVEPNAILLVHYEQQLVPVGFVETLRTLRARGVRVVFCCHWYLYNVLGAYRDLVDAFVVHRPYGNQTIEIPLGCPIYEPETGRLDLRARLGFQPDDIVVTTLGFLSQWKKIPATLEAILSKAKNSRLVFQIQTPRHFSNQESEHEEVAIRAVMAKYPQVQTRLSTDFLPEKDLLDRVYASDLGFVFHGQNTDSVSAANKQFVSARCPLVITESTHGADLKGGVVRVPGFDVAVFAAEVLRIAQNADLRDRLRGDMADEYARINMDVVAEKYMELLGGLT